MNLVFSFDANYSLTFKVLLHSIYKNNPEEQFNIYFLHYAMASEALEDLKQATQYYGYVFYPIDCQPYLEQSEDVTINRYYTVEMYLWLFAPYLLPEGVERALYLDPDIVNLNAIQPFYDTSFEEKLFVAMDYEVKTKWLQPINNLRLGTRNAERYYNTGVVLMNIPQIKAKRRPEEITEAVVKNKAILILPDQDVFNHLYHGHVKDGPWELYNLDPRLYQVGQFVMPDTFNKKWVEEKNVFIHYCGKHKPWQEREKYKMDLGAYYFKYERELENLKTESRVK